MRLIRNILTIQLIFSLFFFYPFSFIYAEEGEQIPDRSTIESQIQEQVQTELTTSSEPQTEQSTDLSNSGDNAQVTSSETTQNETTINNTNTAQVDQNVQASANTGNNEASKNISIGGNAGMINTGDAGVLVGGSINSNQNSNMVGTNSSIGPSYGSVTNTGNGMYVKDNSQSTLLTGVTNRNTAYINQVVDANANTGNNRVDGNISIGGQSGVITTGNAFTSTNFLVSANGNVVIIGGNILILNTGDGSRYSEFFFNRNKTSVNNHNLSYVEQTCGKNGSECSAITGGNTANRNIGFNADAGIIKTGDAVVSVASDINANKNKTTISDPCQTSASSSSSEVINTGDNLEVENVSKNLSKTKINNTNEATLKQNVHATADTGNNKANRNISFGGDAGVIETGNAYVLVGMEAELNSNKTNSGCLITKANPSPTPTPSNPTPTKNPTSTPSPTKSPTPTPTNGNNGNGNNTPTPTPTSVNGGNGDNGDNGSSGNNGNNNNENSVTGGSADDQGEVLGAFAQRLPVTGFMLSLLTLIALCAIALGTYLLSRDYNFIEVERG